MALHWDGLGDFVRAFFREHGEYALIAAPYIQAPALRTILPPRVPSIVVTTWRLRDLECGSSSLEVFRVCAEHENAAVYLHHNLHAKAYCLDVTRSYARALIGSANVTGPGLGIGTPGNVEVLAKLDPLPFSDRLRVQSLINDSTLVTADIVEEFVHLLEEAANDPPPRDLDRHERAADAIIARARKRTLLITDLPLVDSPSRLWDLLKGIEAPEWWEEDGLVHDTVLYADPSARTREEFLVNTRRRFFSHPFVVAFTQQVTTDGMFFGRAKAWLQNECHDVPEPRRRELTHTVQALFRWVTELAPQTFEVVRPNYSECLRRR